MRLGSSIEFTSAKANAGGSAFGTLGFRPGEVVDLITSQSLEDESFITDTMCSSILARDSIFEGEKESMGFSIR